MTDNQNPFEFFMRQAQEMAKAWNPALETLNTREIEKF